MTDEIKLPRLTRDLRPSNFALRASESGDATITFSASSDQPLERWFGTEILSHAAGAVRLDRIAEGAAPLLFNHNWDDPIGMITAGRLADGRMTVEATLFETARAREVRAMMDGGLRNVSIGYEIHVMEEETKANRFTATDWEPFEVSIVTVPADPSVGIGRAAENEITKPVRITRAIPSAPAEISMPTKGKTMDQQQAPQAGAPADISVTDNAAPERLRILTIQRLARTHKVDDATADKWIGEGWSESDVSRACLDIIAERVQKTSRSIGNPAELGLTPTEQRNYSLLNMIRAVNGKNFNSAGFEVETSQAIAQRLGRQPSSPNSFFVPVDIQRRNLSTQALLAALGGGQQRDMSVALVTGSGSHLVGTDHMGFVDLLRNRSTVMQAGARRMSGLVGNVDIPKLAAGATANWQNGESDAIDESTPTTTQLLLSPKTVGAYVELTRRLLQQSSPDAESMVMADMAAQVALAVDLAALEGTGSTGQPTGISATSGIGSVASGAFSYAKSLEFQTDVAAANALAANCAYVTTPAVAALAMQRETIASGGNPIWEGGILDGRMAGMRAMSTNQVTAATMVFGDFSQLIIGEWGVLEIEVNPYADFAKGIIGVRALYSVDVALRHAAAFSRMVTIS